MAFGFQPRGMFGRRKPLSGQGIMPGDQPDYGMGDFPAQPAMQPPMQEMGKGGGLFGKIGGAMGDIGSILDDDDNGRSIEHRKQREFLAQQAQQRAAADDAQWYEREQWKRDNPTPTNNDTVADYEFIRQRLGDAAAAEYLKNKANPPVWRQGDDGRFYQMETAPTGDAPDVLPADFDFGGPSQPATGGFPARR